jgi:ATP-dependent helicase HrpB
MPLPVYEIQTAFREAMRGGVAVVTAPPGSSKSTQIPQWLLADAPQGTRIIVLQPRRLAARMLAERVAWELGTATGETVGYITRFERLVRPTTRILFVTEGILTRMLLHP